MADMVHPEVDSGRMGVQSIHWFGAGLAIVLMAGVAFWGYQLISRDVSVIPIVRALEGPIKIVPETGGGREAEHQGYAVNGVAGTGTAADAVDEVALAPTEVGLSNDDLPLAQMSEVSPVGRSDLSKVEEYTYVSTSAEGLARTTALADQSAARSPVTAEAVSQSLENLRLDAAGDAGGVVGVQVASIVTPAVTFPVAAISDKIAGLKRSLRPIARPILVPIAQSQPVSAVTPAIASEADTTLAAVVASVVAPMVADLDLDPNTLAAGVQLAQVGALDTPAIAQREWQRLAGRFGVLFSDKQRVIQPVENNGRTLYRLRVAGFDGLADARRFCAVIKAGRTDCIPVSHK
jgi:hypothetical protein